MTKRRPYEIAKEEVDVRPAPNDSEDAVPYMVTFAGFNVGQHDSKNEADVAAANMRVVLERLLNEVAE